MRFSLTIIIWTLLLSLALVRLAIACDSITPNKSDLANVFYGTSEEDVKWANDLTNSSIDTVWQNLKNIFKSQEQSEIAGSSELRDKRGRGRQFSGLYIFVSQSMPQALLKNYLHEANKYGGVLVLKGLPQGSFKELAKFVTDITGTSDNTGDIEANIQIDDEAYDKFNVVVVPTIVLSLSSDYHPLESTDFKFDKMVGNVGVKYSLEEFSNSGELKEEARRLLNNE
ncbi:MAG: type-F conjugative transfer system pilin assembly protein TrbC [Rickettsiaceae bacterium]|nr:type-F conjugative transfer system pilin assembly protein TrbC [Rickettsiaceae bacterium]